MEMPARFHRFEGFEVDTLRRELRDPAGALVPLSSKAFDVLCVLIAHRHEVATKEQLLAEAWPGRVVEDNNLTQAIAALRRAFGADARHRRFIVTVPGRGYRFAAEVTDAREAAPVTPDSPTSVSPRAHWRLAVLLGVVLLAAVWAGSGRRASPPVETAPMSLVVLPFQRVDGTPLEDGLLALGLADALSAYLGRQAGLQVRSLASVQRLGALPPDPVAAGRALGATYVLAGTTRIAGAQARVEARLLAVDPPGTLWAGGFDVPPQRLYLLQERIGAAVTAALALRSPMPQARAPSPCEGADVEAYRSLLRAQYRLKHRDLGTIRAFQEAIRRDPACARAYAGLATAYLFMAHNDSAPLEVFPLARAAALHALRIDPGSAEAWMARGRQLQLDEWDWKGAELALRRAIALNPSLAEGHFALAHLLVTTGRFEAGLAEARIARELDPLSPMVNALAGGFLGAAGRPEEAQVQLERALAQQAGFWVPLQIRGGMALDRGDPAAAVRDLEAAAGNGGRNSQTLAVLAFAHVAAGQPDKARALQRELQTRAAQGYLPPTSLAAVATALGDTPAALDALEQAERVRDIRLVFLGIDARWNALRGEPRFRALARRLQLSARPASGRF